VLVVGVDWAEDHHECCVLAEDGAVLAKRRVADSVVGISELARAYYDKLRRRGKSHRQALRQLGNRLVGILHHCLEHGELYDENRAWPPSIAAAA